uniref:CCHC-type domain-containing protein n=1 Tax=Astyanax mexicanus TaxID=7994 RepID=A0A8B9GSG5_ASTMX
MTLHRNPPVIQHSPSRASPADLHFPSQASPADLTGGTALPRLDLTSGPDLTGKPALSASDLTGESALSAPDLTGGQALAAPTPVPVAPVTAPTPRPAFPGLHQGPRTLTNYRQDEPPNRSTVGAQLMQRSWDWEAISSTPQDVVNIVVKFWTGRVADEDVNHYLSRYCDLLQPVEKLLDQFGMWYGVRRYKVKLRRNPSGEIQQIPNTISMGPYTGKITYAGQVQKCFTCGSSDHQVKECNQIKCWKCGQLGHKGKECINQEHCSLCGETNHSYFTCPKSYNFREQILTSVEMT